MEINGFEIEQWNQYKLPENKKVSPCPICSPDRKKKTDPCLMLDWERGLGTCQHCGEVLQLHTFKRKEREKKYELPPQTNFEVHYSDNLIKWAKEERGVEESCLKRLKITEEKEWMPQTRKEENCIVFNYYIGKELVNKKYRDGKKNFKLYKGAEKVLYNLNSIFGRKEVIIVEGEMDVLALTQAQIYNCVSVPNGATRKAINLDYIDNSYQYLEDKEKIIICTDTDEAGINLQQELIRRLGAERCYTIDLKDCKDANEFLIKYSALELQEVFKNPIPVPLEDVETVKDHREELRDFFLNGAPKGFTIGYDNFDDIYSTYTGMYTVVTGIPGHGKSDWVDQMIVGYNLKHGWKCAYCSVENNPSYLHSAKLIKKLGGYAPKGQDQIESQKYKEIEEYVGENFYNIKFKGRYELKAVLQKVLELIRRKGIKVFVLDPFNKIRLDVKTRDVTEYTREYLTILDEFCRQHQVHGIIVAHPSKIKAENGVWQEPNAYSIKGGGEWYDMSPNILLVHRIKEKMLVKVKVLKVKFQHLGTNFAETYFGWNFINGRYMQVETDPEDEHITTHQFKQDNKNWLKEGYGQAQEDNYETSQAQQNIDLWEQKDDLPF